MIAIRPIFIYCPAYRMETPIGFIQIESEFKIYMEKGFAINIQPNIYKRQLAISGFIVSGEHLVEEEDLEKCVAARGLERVV